MDDKKDRRAISAPMSKKRAEEAIRAMKKDNRMPNEDDKDGKEDAKKTVKMREGGMVRGAGKARQGVRPCKMR